MAGPGGKEVGRVSVRVVPNTERFRKKLKRDLEKATKGIKVKIPVEIDKKSLKKLRKDLKDLGKNRKIKITVDVDDRKVDKASRAIERIDESFDRNKDRKFNFDFYFDDDAMRRLREYAMRQKIRILAQLEIDKDRFARNLLREVFKARAQMEVDDHKLQNRLRELEARRAVRIQTQLDLDAIRERNRMQRQMDSQRIKVKADVDNNTLKRIASKIGDALNPSKGAFALFSGGGDFTMFAKFLAVLLLASPLISTVASLIAGLPSLLSMVGAGAAVAYLGFDGIRNSAKQLTPVLDSLKQSLSKTFEKRLTGQFAQLGEAMKAWEPALQKTADGFLDMTTRVMDFVSQGRGMQMINTILENTGTLFSRMAPGMETLTDAFLKLATQGSGAFEYLASAFNTISNGFNDVVQRLSESGAMDLAMKGLSDTVKGLGSAFNSLFEAGVVAMGKMGPVMGRFFTSFGDHIAAMMPHLTAISSAFFDVAASVMDVLTPALEATAPAFTKLMEGITSFATQAIEKFGPAIEQMAIVLSEGLLTVLDQLGPMLPQLVDYFTQLAEIMLQAVKDSGPQMADAFVRIAEAFAQMAPKLAEMMPDLIKLAEEALPMIVRAAPNMVSLFAQMTECFIILAPHLDKIIAAFMIFGTILLTTLNAISRFIAIASQIPGPLEVAKGALNGLKEAVSQVIAKFREVATTIREKLSEAIDAVNQFAADFVAKLTELVSEAKAKATEIANAILTTLTALPGEMAAIGANIVQGLINGLRSKLGEVIGIASQIAGAVKSAFTGLLGINSPSTVFRGYGINIVEGLAEGLKKTAPAEAGVMTLSQHVKRAMDQSNLEQSGKQIGMGIASTIASDLGFSSSGAVGSLINQFVNGTVTPNPKESGPTYIVKDLDEAHRKEDTRKKKAALQFRKR